MLNLAAWKGGTVERYPVGWKEVFSVEQSRKRRPGTGPVTVVDGGLIGKPRAPPAVGTRRHNCPVTERQKRLKITKSLSKVTV